METISDKKIDITKKILEVNDDAVLNKIEHLLTEIETVAYTSEGKALKKSQYINHIEEISSAIEAGAETCSAEDVRDYIKNRK